jgi:hypothetical protein
VRAHEYSICPSFETDNKIHEIHSANGYQAIYININMHGQMINCPRENSQPSGPMTNGAGCKHIYRPACDLLRMDGILSVVYKLFGLVY